MAHLAHPQKDTQQAAGTQHKRKTQHGRYQKHTHTHTMTQAYESQTSPDNLISVKYELRWDKMLATMRSENSWERKKRYAINTTWKRRTRDAAAQRKEEILEDTWVYREEDRRMKTQTAHRWRDKSTAGEKNSDRKGNYVHWSQDGGKTRSPEERFCKLW